MLRGRSCPVILVLSTILFAPFVVTFSIIVFFSFVRRHAISTLSSQFLLIFTGIISHIWRHRNTNLSKPCWGHHNFPRPPSRHRIVSIIYMQRRYLRGSSGRWFLSNLRGLLFAGSSTLFAGSSTPLQHRHVMRRRFWNTACVHFWNMSHRILFQDRCLLYERWFGGDYRGVAW